MNDSKKQMRIYLLLVLGICFLLGVAAFFTQGDSANTAYQILQKGFTAFPVLCAFITRRITGDKSKWRISLKVWKNVKMWLFCAFVPGIMIAVGSALYFVLFPDRYSGVFDLDSLIGGGYEIQILNPLVFGAACVLISALCIPIQLLELGEEIGWREYLLPKQIERYGVRKGVLLNGLCWGTAHLPLIYFGFNYSSENPGAPWSNMAMMMLVCVVIGIICAYAMVRTDNVMYSVIIHGTVNVIGEIPVFVSVSNKSGLLGPNPTGIIGMSGLILCAVIIFVRLGKIENKLVMSE